MCVPQAVVYVLQNRHALLKEFHKHIIPQLVPVNIDLSYTHVHTHRTSDTEHISKSVTPIRLHDGCRCQFVSSGEWVYACVGAMANAIPPLMCNTPPPMDGGCFEDDDDDDLSLAGSIEHDGRCDSKQAHAHTSHTHTK